MSVAVWSGRQPVLPDCHSPSQGPCCTETCSFKGTNERCRLDSDCAKEGTCNGATALCPASEPKENFTSCNSDTQVCLSGVRRRPRTLAARLFYTDVGNVVFVLPTWTRCVPAQFAPSTIWRSARAAPKRAKTRPRSCVTCAVWRRVSNSLQSGRFPRTPPPPVAVLHQPGSVSQRSPALPQ